MSLRWKTSFRILGAATIAVVVATSFSAPRAASGEDASAPAAALFAAEPVVFERVATGYQFTEGPAADARGDIYFTDIRSSRILRFDVAANQASVFREDSGRANGLHFDTKQRLLACEGGRRRLVRIEKDKVTVLAERLGTKRLNSPNDLTIDAHGGVWFTDPRYGKQDDREIDVMAVYYLSPEGQLKQVIRDLPRPNGILLAPSGKTLFVAANKQKLIMSYPVSAPGTLGAGRVFARLDGDQRGGPDGLTLDAKGNLYCAGQGHIFIWSSTGKRLHKLKVPESPTNCTFGGAKRDTLYVTARTSLYRVPIQVKGARIPPPGPAKPKR